MKGWFQRPAFNRIGGLAITVFRHSRAIELTEVVLELQGLELKGSGLPPATETEERMRR